MVRPWTACLSDYLLGMKEASGKRENVKVMRFSGRRGVHSLEYRSFPGRKAHPAININHCFADGTHRRDDSLFLFTMPGTDGVCMAREK